MSWDIFSKSKIQYFLEKLKGKFVQKETGKGLSSNDYTTTDKNKVALIDNTTTSATGNPISIADLKSAQIALNPVITYNPIQDLHGQSKPYPAGGGKNLFDIDSVPFGTVSNGVWTFGGTTAQLNITFKANTQYAFSGYETQSGANKNVRLRVVYTDDTTANVFLVTSTTRTAFTYISTANKSISYVQAYWGSDSSATVAIEKFQIEEGNQATSYAPYENICPISGYDKIEVLSCGVNIWDEQWEVGTYDQTTGNPVATSSNMRSKSTNPIIVGGNTTYYWNCKNGCRAFFYDGKGNYLGNQAISNAYSTFTTPTNAAYMRFHVAGEYGTTYGNNIAVNYPATLNEYAPYHKTTDLSESLGQTVYYGRLDVRTGEFTVLGKAVDMGNLVYTYYQSSDFFYVSSTSMPDVASEVSPSNSWCEIYPIISVTQSNPYILWNGTQLRIYYTGYTDAATFKNAMTGYKLVYPISNPFTIQLTPHEIALSQGYNYISSNGTSISLAYHNGELASLNDVETLGQTVENVVGYLEANNRGTAVNLKPYTSAEPYQFPNDGYVIVYGGSATSGRINVALRGNDGGNFGGIIMNVTSATQMQTTFVRKGMKAYFIADTTGATDDVIEYRALTL